MCNRILRAAALLAVAAGLLQAQTAPTPVPTADQTVRLSEVEVITSHNSALLQAPTDSKLDVLQPQTVINLQTITNGIAPTADYATIANIAPSVSNVETNGPGLSESKHLTLRGFDDAQYNVTFDGIPFGDGNDFSHHTTSYFPAKLLGQVVIDRGPGTASTIGEATFGGTMALYSKDPRTDAAFIPTLSFGSWSTFLSHFEVNTGLLPADHNASAIASYQYMSTDGYRTFATMKRNTYYAKFIQPVGRDTTLTFLSTYNNIKFNNPGTVTLAQIQQFGRNFGQDADPTDFANYYGYNFQTKQADFEYLGVDSGLGGGWRLNDKLYTYAYNNDSHESPNNTSGGVNHKKGADIGGQYKVNLYRSVGDYFLVTHDDAAGTLKFGAWGEYMRNPRYNYYIDYSAAYAAAHPALALPGGILDPNQGNGGFAWDMTAFIKTFQPFAEYAWKATSALLIDAGVKDINFTRDLEARVNQTKDLLPAYLNRTYDQAVPYLSANYRFAPEWSAYAQVAKGFLAPNLNFLETDHPQLDQVQPEQTVNYQAGTVYKHDRLNADADAYWINFSHYPLTQQNPNDPNNPNDVFYTDSSGAYYYGTEAEATVYLGGGTSLYGNGSLNHATFKKSKLKVPGVPDSTASYGVIYNAGSFFGSFVNKYAGALVQYSGSLNPDVAGTAGLVGVGGGYWISDLDLGYSLKFDHSFLHSVKLRFAIDNLFNRDVRVLNSIKSSGAGSYNVLPLRNYYFTVSGEF